jgi:phage portal protein BeeE
MSATGIVEAFGLRAGEETENFIDNIRDTYQGDTNAGGVVIITHQTMDGQSSKFTPLTDQKDGEYQELQALASAAIARAFGWPPALLGEQSSGQLGQNQQLKTAYDLVTQSLVAPLQVEFLKCLNRGLRSAGLAPTVYTATPPQPLTLASQFDPSQVLTVNELRALIGYEELAGGDVIRNIDIETDLT